MSVLERNWTVMVYMAGDNGKLFESLSGRRLLMEPMESVGHKDLSDMEAVGSSEKVAVVAQFDTLSDEDRSFRMYIAPAGQPRQIELLAEQNTGDPRSLQDFIVWGMEKYPAKYYAVIIWNHGSGWKDDDIYSFARQRGRDIGREFAGVGGGRTKAPSPVFISGFVKGAGANPDASRAIAFDDSSMDFLDNKELQLAFAEAEAHTGRKVNLIGMDACLMSMLEVAYQLRSHADVLVGSQEVEPMVGWPYRAILTTLNRRPGIRPATLAKSIVRKYGRLFDETVRGTGQLMTQSALDLKSIEKAVKAFESFISSLEGAFTEADVYAEAAFNRARKEVTRFQDRDYVDLHDFLLLLRDWYRGDNQELIESLEGVLKVLSAGSDDPLILANVALGNGLARAHGISIYLPDNGCSVTYDDLEFASCGWGRLIRSLNKVR